MRVKVTMRVRVGFRVTKYFGITVSVMTPKNIELGLGLGLVSGLVLGYTSTLASELGLG